MMRTRDVEAALHQGASYVGAIMAGGPRNLSLRDAVATLAPAQGRAKRVVVIRPGPVEEMADVAREFDVAQIHGDVTPDDVAALRTLFAGEIWPVVRIAESEIPPGAHELLTAADAVVFDKKSKDGLGGTGERLDWEGLAKSLGSNRKGRMVLAGGLSPLSVTEAVSVLRPDVVDVSSGVENAPGIKNHALLRAFTQAVRRAEAAQ
jgi:phosphoribosylanthranilate isomerase